MFPTLYLALPTFALLSRSPRMDDQSACSQLMRHVASVASLYNTGNSCAVVAGSIVEVDSCTGLPCTVLMSQDEAIIPRQAMTGLHLRHAVLQRL